MHFVISSFLVKSWIFEKLRNQISIYQHNREKSQWIMNFKAWAFKYWAGERSWTKEIKFQRSEEKDKQISVKFHTSMRVPNLTIEETKREKRDERSKEKTKQWINFFKPGLLSIWSYELPFFLLKTGQMTRFWAVH